MNYFNELKKRMSALETLQEIISKNKKVKILRLLEHKVGLNWRQKYRSPESRYNNLEKLYNINKRGNFAYINRNSFLNLNYEKLDKLRKNKESVLSIESEVILNNGKKEYIPLANFHMEKGASLSFIVKQLDCMGFKKGEGAILFSGRNYHFYGINLLKSKKELNKFFGLLLLPLLTTSPGYVGYSLIRDTYTLRLTKDNKFKKTIPYVVKVL